MGRHIITNSGVYYFCSCAGGITLVYLGTMWLLMDGTYSSALPTSGTDYWTAFNFGVGAVRIRKVFIAEGYASHLFHISLPKEMEIVNNTTPPPCDPLCGRMKAIPVAIQGLRSSITSMIAEVYDLVPDLDERSQIPRRRPSRGFFDFIGSAGIYAFGLATEGDVDGLKRK